MDDFKMSKVKKLGIQCKPPALVLVYPTEKEKMHKRVMPIRNFRSDSYVSFVATELRSRHEKFLMSVPIGTIEKMLRILQVHMKGSDLQTAIEAVRSEYEVNPNEDLNKLSSDELQRKKLLMEASFTASHLGPSHPDFEYDKRVEFEQDDKIESGWDTDGGAPPIEEEGDDFWS